MESICSILLFFFNDTATTEIYTLSLHDALPISIGRIVALAGEPVARLRVEVEDDLALVEELLQPLHLDVDDRAHLGDRKSTRLNSSHANISYAVFCLKKKKIDISYTIPTNTTPF